MFSTSNSDTIRNVKRRMDQLGLDSPYQTTGNNIGILEYLPEEGRRRGGAVKANIRDVIDAQANKLLLYITCREQGLLFDLIGESGPRIAVKQDIFASLVRSTSYKQGQMGTTPTVNSGRGPDGRLPRGSILNQPPEDLEIDWISIDHQYLSLIHAVSRDPTVLSALDARQKQMLSDGFEITIHGRPLHPDIMAALSPKLGTFLKGADNARETDGFILFGKDEQNPKVHYGCPFIVSPFNVLIQFGTNARTLKKYSRVLSPVIFNRSNPHDFRHTQMKKIFDGSIKAIDTGEDDRSPFTFGWFIRADIECVVHEWPDDMGRTNAAMASLLEPWVSRRLDTLLHNSTNKMNSNRSLLCEENKSALNGMGPYGNQAWAKKAAAASHNSIMANQAVGSFGRSLAPTSGNGGSGVPVQLDSSRSSVAVHSRMNRGRPMARRPLSAGEMDGGGTGESLAFYVDLANQPDIQAQMFDIPPNMARYYATGNKFAELVNNRHITYREPGLGKDISYLRGNNHLREVPEETGPSHYVIGIENWKSLVLGITGVPRILLPGESTSARSNQQSVVEEYQETLSSLAQGLQWYISLAMVRQWGDLSIRDLIALCDPDGKESQQSPSVFFGSRPLFNMPIPYVLQSPYANSYGMASANNNSRAQFAMMHHHGGMNGGGGGSVFGGGVGATPRDRGPTGNIPHTGFLEKERLPLPPPSGYHGHDSHSHHQGSTHAADTPPGRKRARPIMGDDEEELDDDDDDDDPEEKVGVGTGGGVGGGLVPPGEENALPQPRSAASDRSVATGAEVKEWDIPRSPPPRDPLSPDAAERQELKQDLTGKKKELARLRKQIQRSRTIEESQLIQAQIDRLRNTLTGKVMDPVDIELRDLKNQLKTLREQEKTNKKNSKIQQLRDAIFNINTGQNVPVPFNGGMNGTSSFPTPRGLPSSYSASQGYMSYSGPNVFLRPDPRFASHWNPVNGSGGVWASSGGNPFVSSSFSSADGNNSSFSSAQLVSSSSGIVIHLTFVDIQKDKKMLKRMGKVSPAGGQQPGASSMPSASSSQSMNSSQFNSNNSSMMGNSNNGGSINGSMAYPQQQQQSIISPSSSSSRPFAPDPTEMFQELFNKMEQLTRIVVQSVRSSNNGDGNPSKNKRKTIELEVDSDSSTRGNNDYRRGGSSGGGNGSDSSSIAPYLDVADVNKRKKRWSGQVTLKM